jgi:20S proteasome alpha/beta subunit
MIITVLGILLGIFLTLICPGLSSVTFGVVMKDSVIISSSSTFQSNGVILKGDHSYIHEIQPSMLLSVHGDCSDCNYLLSAVSKKMEEYEVTAKNGYVNDMTLGTGLSVKDLAHLCRKVIAENLRSRPLRVEILLAGWEMSKNQPCLFRIDSIASLQEVRYTACGRDSLHIISTLDNVLHGRDAPGSCSSLAKLCWSCICHRSMTNYGNYATLAAIDKEGVTNSRIPLS